MARARSARTARAGDRNAESMTVEDGLILLLNTQEAGTGLCQRAPSGPLSKTLTMVVPAGHTALGSDVQRPRSAIQGPHVVPLKPRWNRPPSVPSTKASRWPAAQEAASA